MTRCCRCGTPTAPSPHSGRSTPAATTTTCDTRDTSTLRIVRAPLSLEARVHTSHPQAHGRVYPSFAAPGYPDCAGHACCIPAYAEPELYAWLLRKTRHEPPRLADLDPDLKAL
eukprot:1376730-Prymnesium_polylepis.2